MTASLRCGGYGLASRGTRFAKRCLRMTTIERLHARGIHRLGNRRAGFRYRRADGGAAARHDVARIRDLRLPPAWREVAVAGSPQSRVQAVGRDAKGRWQYVYHPAHVRRRERDKHQRLLRFGEALPRLRQAVRRDLRLRGLPRDKVLAVIARILASTFLRPGSEAYAAENGSFGLATLRRRHVVVRGDTVQFDFPGKSGKRQRRTLRNRRIAGIVRRLVALPGYEVFKYLDDDGRPVDIKRADITEYIKRTMGDAFTAKDFRTWSATLICACALAHQRPAIGESAAGLRHTVAAAMRETAAQLGNTAAVCRSSYVDAAVPRAFAGGTVIARAVGDVADLASDALRGRHACEAALLRLLRGSMRRRRGAGQPRRE